MDYQSPEDPAHFVMCPAKPPGAAAPSLPALGFDLRKFFAWKTLWGAHIARTTQDVKMK